MATQQSQAGILVRLAEFIVRHSSLRSDVEERLRKIEEHSIPLLEQRVEAIEKIPADGYIKRAEETAEKVQVVRGYTPFSQRKRELEARLARKQER